MEELTESILADFRKLDNVLDKVEAWNLQMEVSAIPQNASLQMATLNLIQHHVEAIRAKLDLDFREVWHAAKTLHKPIGGTEAPNNGVDPIR